MSTAAGAVNDEEGGTIYYTIIGGALALTSGACIALSMVIQRYALCYPQYWVRMCGCCSLPRPYAWMLGFVFYIVANMLFAGSTLLGPLSLNATLFTMLLAWNLMFAKAILGEVLTRPRVVGAVIVVIGAGVSVSGTPLDAPSKFNVTIIGELVQQPLGASFLVLQVRVPPHRLLIAHRLLIGSALSLLRLL